MATLVAENSFDSFNTYVTEFLDFKFPRTKVLTNYTSSFKSSIGTEPARQFIEKIQSTRVALFHVMLNHKDCQSILTAIDEYLPMLYHFTNSLMNQEKVQADTDLIFEWCGCFSPDNIYFSSTDVVYEILMIIHTKAIVHFQHAKQLLEIDRLSFLPEAAKNLLSASSALAYMGAQLAGKWNKVFNIKVPNPPELNSTICNAIALYFKLLAQQLSVVKAVNNEANTPPSIIAKLCIGVVNSSKSNIEAVSHYAVSVFHPRMLTSIAIALELFEAIACIYLAKVAYDKNDCGLAMGFCDFVKNKLVEQKGKGYNFQLAGLPKLTLEYAHLSFAVKKLLEKCESIRHKADQENKLIYFQTIPKELPPYPTEACIMNPPAFVEPVNSEPLIVFIYQPEKKPSFMSSFFKKTSSTSTVSATSPQSASTEKDEKDASMATSISSTVMASTPAMYLQQTQSLSKQDQQLASDEAMAKALQEQYNSGR